MPHPSKSQKRAHAPDDPSKRPHLEGVSSTNMEEADQEGDMNFEDPHTDEEIEEVVLNPEDAVEPTEQEEIAFIGDDDEEMEEDEGQEPARATYYAPRPEMEVVRSEYDMLHAIDTTNSILCFDVVKDPFGASRHKYPLSCVTVNGCYGEKGKETTDCYLVLMKIGHLCRTKYDEDPDGYDSENSSSDEEDEGEGDDAEDPTLNEIRVEHKGLPLNVRSMPHNPGVVASWSANGHINVFNLNLHLQSLTNPESYAKAMVEGKTAKSRVKPIFQSATYEHVDYGYALSWNPLEEGVLASGDKTGRINVWKRDTNGGSFVRTEFHKHTKACECIEWNPGSKDTFASCSSDGTIRFWDLRTKQEERCINADIDNDVNVISWNPIKKTMLASGHEDGTFKIWDLRVLKTLPKGQKDVDPLISFDFHKACRQEAPNADVEKAFITGISFSPHQESLLAVSDDEQVTLWDLSAETDDAEAQMGYMENGRPVPPHLFFGHRGLQSCRAIQWHAQIPGMLLDCTSACLDIWKPARWRQMVELPKKRPNAA